MILFLSWNEKKAKTQDLCITQDRINFHKHLHLCTSTVQYVLKLQNSKNQHFKTFFKI